MMGETKCLECGANLNIQDDAVVGEIVSCPDCGSDYEISSLENGMVTVKTAETVKEDWGE
jgi:alpha-aminoadipate carrier protein LysW